MANDLTASLSFEEILVSIVSQVATITLNRPNRGNSISGVMRLELIKAFEILEKNDFVRVIVITGAGKFFCSGGDLGSGSFTKGGANAASESLQMFKCIQNSTKPVICKVNGPALGGGVGLVFACDIRIVSKDAYFCFPEVKRGIVPALISALIVPQLGIYKSKQFMITGERISVEELLSLGVITSITGSGEELDKSVVKYSEMLITSAPNATSSIKSLVEYISDHDADQNSKYVQEIFAKMMTTEEASYGIQSFIQKQTPDWSKFLKESKAKL